MHFGIYFVSVLDSINGAYIFQGEFLNSNWWSWWHALPSDPHMHSNIMTFD